MRNWSTDTKRLKKFPSEYRLWKTEQLINFGLDENEKLDKDYVQKHIKTLNIDPEMRSYLGFVLADDK